MYPLELSDLTRPRTGPPTAGVDDGGALRAIAPGSYQGPYVSFRGGIAGGGIPVNPYKERADADYARVAAHWEYRDPAKGTVHSAFPVPADPRFSDEHGAPYLDL